jgi:hypothetical protein
LLVASLGVDPHAATAYINVDLRVFILVGSLRVNL